jgi:hypothetical protein
MLVVATSGTGYVLGSAGSAVDLAGLCWTCAGTMMVASSANSLNQVLFSLLSLQISAFIIHFDAIFLNLDYQNRN